MGLTSADIKNFRLIGSANDSKSLQDPTDVLRSWRLDRILQLSKEKRKEVHLGAKNPNYSHYVHGSLIGSVDEVGDGSIAPPSHS